MSEATNTDTPRERTDTYPVRYAAFDREGVLFEGPMRDEPGELAVYYRGEQNERFPHLRDGAYVEARRYPKGAQAPFAVLAMATRPDGHRVQWAQTEWAHDHLTALRWTLRLIAAAEAHMAGETVGRVTL